MPEIRPPRGRLVLVAGPSGAGKDAVIDGARKRLGGNPRFVFPLRTISRPEGFGGEIHVAVTPAQFDRLRRVGAFALYWGAGGLNYAIPASIDADLAAGRTVVANVSSVVFPEARARYRELLIVWITAGLELRRKRLVARGREPLSELDERLRSTEEMPLDEDIEVLENEGALSAAVDAFLALIEARAGVVEAPADRAAAERGGIAAATSLERLL